MSSAWKVLRNDVLIADLATTDIDMEALQTEAAGIVFAAPQIRITDSSETVKEFVFVVYAYAGLTPYAGTLTAQIIEKSPHPDTGIYHYVGATPNVLLPTGRGFTLPGRYIHKFTVRMSSFVGVGPTHLRVLWKHLR